MIAYVTKESVRGHDTRTDTYARVEPGVPRDFKHATHQSPNQHYNVVHIQFPMFGRRVLKYCTAPFFPVTIRVPGPLTLPSEPRKL